MSAPKAPETFEHLGFTGSRWGLTEPQIGRLEVVMEDFRDEHGAKISHDGDCKGGDATFNRIALELGLRRVGHPPASEVMRARCDYDELREPKPYAARNRDIVDEVAVMIGCPHPRRSSPGTISTISYAVLQAIPCLVINAYGETEWAS